MGASQDGSHEFLSLLACICADGTKLPPALIYQGESHDMLDSWLQDSNEGDEAYFASTANGWSYNELGLQWLQRCFIHIQKIKLVIDYCGRGLGPWDKVTCSGQGNCALVTWYAPHYFCIYR